MRHNGLTKEASEAVNEMILAGAKYSEIGRLYGLSRDACRKRREYLGLPPRHRKRKRIAAGPTDDEYGHIEVPGMPTQEEIASRALAAREETLAAMRRSVSTYEPVCSDPPRVECMVAKMDRRRR